MSELKPCPLCGGKAMVSLGKMNDGSPWRYLECDTCSMTVDTDEDWNRRDPCPDCAELRRELEEARAWRRRWGLVVEAAVALTNAARRMGVLDPMKHIAVAVDLREYAAKENVLFRACEYAVQPAQAQPTSAESPDALPEPGTARYAAAISGGSYRESAGRGQGERP